MQHTRRWRRQIVAQFIRITIRNANAAGLRKRMEQGLLLLRREGIGRNRKVAAAAAVEPEARGLGIGKRLVRNVSGSRSEAV